MIKRILIANRGEIAIRIARTCKTRGIPVVAVFSPDDATSEHITFADSAVRLPAGPLEANYLNIPAIIEAARSAGADAIHPGYGFLSESPSFARAVEAAGLVFIGPAPDTIDEMGDKANAKRIMRERGVSVAPGSTEPTENIDELFETIKEIGTPVILKPTAGGGGKGMQVIRDPDPELVRSACESAIRVATNTFGDGRLIVERYIESPRHIEVQVAGDGNGEVIHLFERECSVQRRHQKVIEEAPAPNLPEATRQAVIEDAVRGARAIRYRGVGTFEFVVGASGDHYFLEANTRIQVEHPVTEEVTGVDLVGLQIDILQDGKLPFAQEEITVSGHAIEARVYAEDSENNFRPSPGVLHRVVWPLSSVRVDSAYFQPGSVSTSFDPMIAKLISSGRSRREAIQKLVVALNSTTLHGSITNLGFLVQLLTSREFQMGEATTGFVDAFQKERLTGELITKRRQIAAASAALRILVERYRKHYPLSPGSGRISEPNSDVLNLGEFELTVNGSDPVRVRAREEHKAQLVVTIDDDRDYAFGIRHGEPYGGASIENHVVKLFEMEDSFDVSIDGYYYKVRRHVRVPSSGGSGFGESGSVVKSEIPGTITAVFAKNGDKVDAGQALLALEAMKMEYELKASCEGYVSGLTVRVGDRVDGGIPLAYVLAEEPAAE
ncbi:MAG: acetyl/propionyl/methylcrotonyl-CoA carboxylase subunit alpha [Segniliparus sp.]|uniref:acetyl/propionyl/methylcrotonyl-CoA carboxylase subunit alpha n=1 Tax=Segniliparus sp. TaxID=2804064 RepID=UPI003F317873